MLSHKRQLTHFQDGQRIQNKAVVNIEVLTILVKCGAMQFSQNFPWPLSCFYREQEVKEGQFGNKISRLASQRQFIST
jgi:hypothetical protein